MKKNPPLTIEKWNRTIAGLHFLAARGTSGPKGRRTTSMSFWLECANPRGVDIFVKKEKSSLSVPRKTGEGRDESKPKDFRIYFLKNKK
jgi:hypothetical protein